MEVAVSGMSPAAGFKPVPAPDLDRGGDRLLEGVEGYGHVFAHLAAAASRHREADPVAPAPELALLGRGLKAPAGERVRAKGLLQLGQERRHGCSRAVAFGRIQ